MSGIVEAWLRWRLGEEGEEAREWAARLVSEHRPVLERVGRRLHGLSAALASGSGRQDVQAKLHEVWKFLDGQQKRADKRGHKDEVDLWQKIREQLNALGERATHLLNRLADDVIAAEESESQERLQLVLIELHVNTLVACQQAGGELQ